MIEVRPSIEDLDRKVLRTFMKAIEILGGPRKLIEYRHLTWLPSLMEACYVVVLKQEHLRTEDDIARELGVSRETVRRILSSDPKTVMERVKGEIRAGELREHIAGGIAKIAWEEVRRGRWDVDLIIDSSRRALEAIEGPTWAIMTLMRIKGMDFPLKDSSELEKRLEGVRAYGIERSKVVKKIEYPVNNPAELLRKMSERIKAELGEEA